MVSAGSKAKGGFYFNLDQWDLVAVAGKEGVLPGPEGQRYRRVPAWAALVVAPLLGGLFVVFLPLIGCALVAWHAGSRLANAVRRTERTADSARPSQSG